MYRFVVLFLSATLAIIGCGTAGAQSAATFPERPIRLVLAFGPGGLADITFRLVAEKLTGSSASRWWSRTSPARAA